MKILLIPIFLISLNCFAVDEVQGTWNFLEVISNPFPEEGLKPFPKSIVIEFIGENEGKLTIQLRAQSKLKIYLFSKTHPKKSKTVQTYYEGTQHEYSNREEATISYSEGILSIQLKWAKITDAKEEAMHPVVATGSYTFVPSEKGLLFTRTNTYQSRKSVFKALYFQKK